MFLMWCSDRLAAAHKLEKRGWNDFEKKRADVITLHIWNRKFYNRNIETEHIKPFHLQLCSAPGPADFCHNLGIWIQASNIYWNLLSSWVNCCCDCSCNDRLRQSFEFDKIIISCSRRWHLNWPLYCSDAIYESGTQMIGNWDRFWDELCIF